MAKFIAHYTGICAKKLRIYSDYSRLSTYLCTEQTSNFMVKKGILSALIMLAPFAGAFAQDVIGKWKLSNGSAIVEVYQSGDVYNGKIVWLANPTEADGTPAVDDKNPDKSLRSRRLIGLNMLSNLKKQGDKYSGGLIYDPANGKTYNCSMKVSGNMLKVRGSLDKSGILGRTMEWYRAE